MVRWLAPVLMLLVAGGVWAEDVVETAEDGTVRVRYEVDEQGRKSGRYERFHPDGSPAVKATYKADQRHGLERTWDPGGVLRTAHTYRQGVLHGAHKTYDETGRMERHQTFKRGVLHGPFKQYHPNRRLHIVAAYRNGKRHGKYQERLPDGTTRLRTTYREGLLDGAYEVFDGKRALTKQVWQAGRPIEVDGIVPFPRAPEAIRREFARVLQGPLPATPLDADRELALRQLKAYRYLVGVPYDDIVLDDTCNREAQAGSEVCAALGRITHTPTNPGWSLERFAVAARGAQGSNLHQGQRTAAASVRGYMDDSDKRNIDRVGHRAWALNPAMQKTGFGFAKGFTAMWATDKSRARVPQYEFLSLPPPGYVPGPWLGAHWAWSVWLDTRRYDAPHKVKVQLEALGADFLPLGRPLQLNHTKVLQKGVAMPYAVIFRAWNMSLEPGRRYRVTLNGLTHKGKPKPLRYFVEFFDLPYERPVVPDPDDEEDDED